MNNLSVVFAEKNPNIIHICMHALHKNCALNWIQTSGQIWCPICRKKFNSSLDFSGPEYPENLPNLTGTEYLRDFGCLALTFLLFVIQDYIWV